MPQQEILKEISFKLKDEVKNPKYWNLLHTKSEIIKAQETKRDKLMTDIKN